MNNQAHIGSNKKILKSYMELCAVVGISETPNDLGFRFQLDQQERTPKFTITKNFMTRLLTIMIQLLGTSFLY